MQVQYVSEFLFSVDYNFLSLVTKSSLFIYFNLLSGFVSYLLHEIRSI
jgi:hypothetical protein